MAQVVVRDISKVFGRRPKLALDLLDQGVSREEILRTERLTVAVRDASFEVDDGELFVVMGLSGSGKSTLVRMINRLYEPTRGTVEIDGQDVGAMDDQVLRELRMRRISMVFQHFALFPHRRVWENAAYGLQVQHVPPEERRQRAHESLEAVGLAGWGDKYPQELSGGMRQRVGLARALATNADVLLMDEPFSALDPLIKRDMQNLLIDLQRRMRRTIVFITHDLNEAMRIGDRIAVMKDGEVVQVGTGGEIVAEPANEYVAEFVSDVDRSRVLTADYAMRPPRATAVPTDSPRKVLEQLRDLELNGMYVLDGEERILGVARDDVLARAIREGTTEVGSALVHAYAAVPPSTPLVNLSRLAAEDPVPIAVRDETGHLLGVVPRAALLAALAGPNGDEGHGT
jgi:glycine betaine/proline transport system ATP-binding protein